MKLAVDWEMLFYNVRKFLVPGDTVAVVCECCWRHKKTGNVVHTPKLDIVRFKGEKMADFFEYFDKEEAINACSGVANSQSTQPPKPIHPENGAQVVEGETEASRASVALVKSF